MSYNRVGTPKFYMDAVLLARQWGMIEAENASGLFYLNPSNILSLNIVESPEFFSISFKNRYFINSISHCFVLGHNFKADDIVFTLKGENIDSSQYAYLYYVEQPPDNNGWHKFEWLDGMCTDKNLVKLAVRLSGEVGSSGPLGDISAGWSYTMQHSSDLELTQSYSNKSVKHQTTLGGHTLSNAGYNHKAGWIRPAWSRGGKHVSFENENFKVFPSGRRSWNLKFSMLSDDDSTSPLFPFSSHDSYGIFANISGETADEDDSLFSIKEDFLSKVWFSTNCGQLPFIFQPNKDVEDEFAICRIDSDTASFEQVANNVYNISLDIVEVW